MKTSVKAVLALLILTGPVVAQPVPSDQGDTAALIRAYPDFLAGVDGQNLLWKDSTKMPLTRNTASSYTERLNQPGLLDQLDAPYPDCAPLGIPALNSDPGRARYEPLFLKMYGASAAQVRQHLEGVNWFGQTVQVTSINGAAASLRQVAQEVGQHPDLLRYTRPSAGTFLWRRVAGTPRLSVHSFGAAIDLNTAYSDYWLWRGFREGQLGITYCV